MIKIGSYQFTNQIYKYIIFVNTSTSDVPSSHSFLLESLL